MRMSRLFLAAEPIRAVKPEEAAKLIGEEALKRVKTISHYCSATDLVYVGTTKTHGNKVYVEPRVR